METKDRYLAAGGLVASVTIRDGNRRAGLPDKWRVGEMTVFRDRRRRDEDREKLVTLLHAWFPRSRRDLIAARLFTKPAAKPTSR